MGEIEAISERFFPEKRGLKIETITGGYIHKTFKISFSDGEAYVLQSINVSVFKDPFAVMDNILLAANHLKTKNYPFKILQPIASNNGFLEIDKFGNYWRAFPFFKNTVVFEKVSDSRQAFEAAKAFGLFIKYLDGIAVNSIKETIPDFHNLKNRMSRFDQALKDANPPQVEKAKEAIESILVWYRQLTFDFKKMPLRVVHNDTKISNVLLDKDTLKGVCVIDLDTMMQGYLVHDFGDMIRTMCCTAPENETDLDKVAINVAIFKAMTKGFLSEIQTILKKEEQENLLSGGLYIIFEQAIRFLTDYLKGNIYYPVHFNDQNLFRAKNQLRLFESLLDNKNQLELIINELT